MSAARWIRRISLADEQISPVEFYMSEAVKSYTVYYTYGIVVRPLAKVFSSEIITPIHARAIVGKTIDSA